MSLQTYFACAFLTNLPILRAFYSASSPFIRPSPLKAPLLLCHVCTVWCSVAIASATLWNSLDATSIHYLPNYQILDLWLKRSKRSLLSLRFFTTFRELCQHLAPAVQALFPRAGALPFADISGWYAPNVQVPEATAALALQDLVVGINCTNWAAAAWFEHLLTNAPLLTNLYWSGTPTFTAPGRSSHTSPYRVENLPDLQTILRHPFTSLTELTLFLWLGFSDTSDEFTPHIRLHPWPRRSPRAHA
ncbi:hypothetical protein C8J57DRAFT_1726494 [Mycena rebaudengoi]|nr:hypothetical protein C8J57DRAFT_1726494 [Mycena rebaudengoi]